MNSPTKQLLYQTNLQGITKLKGTLVHLGLLFMFVLAPISVPFCEEILGFYNSLISAIAVFTLFFIGCIFLFLARDNPTYQLSFYKTAIGHAIHIQHSAIDYTIEGRLTYEAWQLLRYSDYRTHSYIPHLSITSSNQHKLLIYTQTDFRAQQTNWGVVRGLSNRPIDHVFHLKLKELQALRAVLKKHGITAFKA